MEDNFLQKKRDLEKCKHYIKKKIIESEIKILEIEIEMKKKLIKLKKKEIEIADDDDEIMKIKEEVKEIENYLNNCRIIKTKKITFKK